MAARWQGIVLAGQDDYRVVVVQKDTGVQGWRRALEEAGFEDHHACDLGMCLRLFGPCRGPRSQRVAIGAYDESVNKFPWFDVFCGGRRAASSPRL